MNDEKKAQLVAQFQAHLETSVAADIGGDNEGGNRFSVLAELVAVKTAVRLESRQFKQALAQFSDVCEMFTDDQMLIELEPVDELALLRELTALKTEVKQESQQYKQVLEQVKTLYTELQQRQQTFQQQLQRHREQIVQQVREGIRPLLLQLVTLGDGLQAGVDMPPPQFGKLARLFCKAPLAWIPKSYEGLQINLQQLQALLKQHNVTPIEALGETFDPHTMKVIEVDQLSDVAEGVVTLEIRKGYEWDGALLRYAEVKVNRLIN